MKILVLKGDSYLDVASMLANRGHYVEVTGNDRVAPLGGVEVVVFTGGSDVSPSLYCQKNTCSYTDPLRDKFEESVYRRCVELGINMVGICRGGQFLNVMNGGSMIQHIEGHNGCAVMSTSKIGNGGQYKLIGDHHQAIVPHKDGEVFVTCDSDDVVLGVNYTSTNSFCFQQHPEWDQEGDTALYFFAALGHYGYNL